MTQRRRPRDPGRRGQTSRRRKPAPASSSNIIWICVGAGGGLLVVVLVLVAMFSGGSSEYDEPDADRPAKTVRKAADPPAESRPSKQKQALQTALERARTAIQAALDDDDLPAARAAAERFASEVSRNGGDAKWGGIAGDLAEHVNLQAAEKTKRWVGLFRLHLKKEEFGEAGEVLDRLRAEPGMKDRISGLARQLADAEEKALAASGPSTTKDPPKRDPAPTDPTPPTPTRLRPDSTPAGKLAQIGIQHFMKQGVSDFRVAIQYFAKALKLDPKLTLPRGIKCAIHTELGQGEKGLAEGLVVLKDPAIDPSLRVMTEITVARCYGLLVEPAKAREWFGKVIAKHPNNGDAYFRMGQLLRREGKYQKALDSYMKAATVPGGPMGWAVLEGAACYMLMGRADKAYGAYSRMYQNPQGSQSEMGQRAQLKCWALAGMAWCQEAAKGTNKFTRQNAIRCMATWIQTRNGGRLAQSYSLAGIVFVRFARNSTALEMCFERGPNHVRMEPYFHEGVARLEMGQHDAALRIFKTVLRWQPARRDKILALRGIGPIEDRLKRALADFDGRDMHDKVRVEEDHEALAPAVDETDGKLSRLRFDEALEDYKGLKQWAKASSLKTALDRRIALGEGYLGLLDRLISAINDKTLPDRQVKLADRTLKIIRADRKRFQIAVAGGGTAKVGWGTLAFPLLLGLFEQLKLAPIDRFLLGTLAWDRGMRGRAHGLFVRVGNNASLKSKIDQFLADKLQIDLPKGGFVQAKGRFLTPEQMKKEKAGQVFYRGRWMSRDERGRLQRGERLIDGQWVQQKDKALMAAGLVKVDGKWEQQGDLDRRAGDWQKAESHATPHFELQSDRGGGFLANLEPVIEAAYAKLSGQIGAQPRAKLVVKAFKNKSDYQAYLRKLGKPAHEAALAAIGMAGAEPHTVAVYDRHNDQQRFSESILQFVAVQYVRETCGSNAPAWLCLGLGAQFEGFKRSRSKIIWAHAPRRRLLLLRRALRQNGLLTLADLTSRSPASLGSTRKALIFEAQAWALTLFFGNTIDKQFRDLFGRYLAHLKGGGSRPLMEFVAADDRELLGTAFEFYAEDL